MSAELKTYRRKRNFDRTPEPEGRARAPAAEKLQFVVQKHDARRLHYDFRLEHDGVLKSWAVPKGPSLDPKERRLAVQTEDHPLEYATFEGVIPEREYGGGPVLVWDRGYWTPEKDPDRGLAKGKLDFELHGEKLRGRWTLVRMPAKKDAGRSDKDNWLLIKRTDREARPSGSPELVDTLPQSVLTGRDIEAVAAAQDRVWHSDGGEATKAATPEVGRPDTVPGARRARLPAKLEVMRPERAEQVPRGTGWFHEAELCGVRLLGRVADGKASLRTATGDDASERFAALADALAALPCRTALLDAEAVVFDEGGVSERELLERALNEDPSAVVLVAFDLLHLDGFDLRGAALRARKELLRLLLTEAPGAIRYGDHVEGHGADFHREACRLGLAGVVSKRAHSRYRAAHGGDWVVAACGKRSP